MTEPGRETNRAFILQVATTGDDLSAHLIRFASKWNHGQQSITNVAVTASIIANLLRDIAGPIEKHGEDDGLEHNAIHFVCACIKLDYISLARALYRADLKAGPGRFVTRRATRFTPVKNSGENELVKNTEWNAGMADQSHSYKRPDGEALLQAELGADTLVAQRLEEARDHLWYIYQGFQYLTLKRLQKEERLQPHEALELERLVEQLPTILAELEARKRPVLQAAERVKAVEARKMELLQGHQDGAADDIRWKDEINDVPVAQRNVDDDSRSIASFNSVTSYQFLDINEVYEAWVIRKFEGEKNWPRKSWSLGWFTVYEYYNSSGYEIEAQAMTIEQMKEKSEAVMSGEFKPEHTALIEKKMATLPVGVEQEIRVIIDDRARVSTNPRFRRKWKIVDIITKFKAEVPVPVWMMPFKGQPAFSEALFIIKGETAGPNDVTKPVRDEDPFQKPRYRRCRGHETQRDVMFDRRPQRHVREGNQAQRDSAGLVIGDRIHGLQKALDLEEAEAKIQYILAEFASLYTDDNEGLVLDEVMV